MKALPLLQRSEDKLRLSRVQTSLTLRSACITFAPGQILTDITLTEALDCRADPGDSPRFFPPILLVENKRWNRTRLLLN